MDLIEQKCIPCEGGTPPLNKTEAEVLLGQVPGWHLSSDGKKISKHYEFKDFAEARTFVNFVADIAENEGHHPDIHLVDYKYVDLSLWTHAIDGLSQNDFIVAAKIDTR
jgi:4a-hydroxytetrahydrobiopterin dehydratase